jgi:hypothetical protein
MRLNGPASTVVEFETTQSWVSGEMYGRVS